MNTSSSETSIFSFAAGKLILDGNFLKPEPELRKGTIDFVQKNSQITLRWKLRPEGTIIDEFPLDKTSTVIRQVPLSGSSYGFQVKGNGQSLFYWIQEPNTTPSSFSDILSQMQHLAKISTVNTCLFSF